jgi:hypothetical protein
MASAKAQVEGQWIRGEVIAKSATHYEIRDVKSGFVYGIPKSDVITSGAIEGAAIKKAAKKKVATKHTNPKAVKAGSKIEQAVAIYKSENGDRQVVISRIEAELGMSKAGATTYFYNAKKKAV